MEFAPFMAQVSLLIHGQVEEKDNFATIEMEAHHGNGWSGENSYDVRFELGSNHLMQIIDGKCLHLFFLRRKNEVIKNESDGKSTTSLCSLFQWLIILSVKKTCSYFPFEFSLALTSDICSYYSFLHSITEPF